MLSVVSCSAALSIPKMVKPPPTVSRDLLPLSVLNNQLAMNLQLHAPEIVHSMTIDRSLESTLSRSVSVVLAFSAPAQIFL